MLYQDALLFLSPYNCRIIRDFSWSSCVFVCESFLWSATWPEWGGVDAGRRARGFRWAFSQRRPRHYYCYSERRRRDLAVQSGKVWSGHGRNGTASTFHTSLGVSANFLYCTLDWKHIWNIFSWSHLRCTKERKVKRERERDGESGRKKVQNMSQCTELTLNLANIFFFLILLFFQPWINQKCAEL